METIAALTMFDALSQETRLAAFRELVRAGNDGLAAGVLGERLGTPHNTLSFHLNQLSNAGLVTATRQGRSIIYRAAFDAMRGLIAFLVEDCCSAEQASLHRDRKRGCDIIEINDCCPG